MEQNKLKLEDYCLTIEQAKELQELGVNMSDTSMIIIQFHNWRSGKPYCSPQNELRQIHKIGLQKAVMTYDSNDDVPQVWIDGKKQ